KAALPANSTLTLAQADPATKARLSEAYGKLPLSFEANHGQTDPSVKFISRGQGYNLYLTGTEAVLQLRNADSRLRNEKTAVATHQLHHPRSASRISPSAVLRMKLLGT